MNPETEALAPGSLEDSLQRVVCNLRSVKDVSEGKEAIKWLTAIGDPADFCTRLNQLIEASPDKTVSLSTVRQIGGFSAHLELVTYDSGLVAAMVHAESHGLVRYHGGIAEIRGMTGDLPDIGYPHSMEVLVAEGFELQVLPYEIETEEGKLLGYITTGEKTVLLGVKAHGAPKATLTYGIFRPMAPDLTGEYFPSLVMAEVSVVEGANRFSITFNCNPVRYELVYGEPAKGAHEFVFDSSGELVKVASVKTLEGDQKMSTAVDKEKWPAAFDICFNTRYTLPAINAAQTLPKMLLPFTGHRLLAPEDSYAGSQAVTLDRVVSFQHFL